MLSQYSNIEQIKTTNTALVGERFTVDESALLKYPIARPKYPNVNGLSDDNLDTRIELHLYSNETWITGNHTVQQKYQIPQYIDPITNQTIVLRNPIAFDLREELDKLNITAGSFRIAVNFFKNLIGDYAQQYLAIDEISPDRTELRLKPIDASNQTYLTQIASYINTVNQPGIINNVNVNIHRTYLLNFSRNQCVEFVNSVETDGFLYVKLRNPLPDIFDVNFKLWIVQEIKQPYLDSIILDILPITSQTFNTLAGANWDATSTYNTSNETGLRNWNDILGSSTQTSQQLVDAYFSGSLSGVKLNIDYSDFNNFIFYSSAVERISNFRYKLELLEYYQSQSIVVATISGSVAQNNAQDFLQLRTNLIGGFDNFEQYLYYQSESRLTTYDIPVIDAAVPQLTGSYVTPAPKTNSTVPYTLASTTSSQFVNWYDSLYDSASLYDSLNTNALVYAVPEYIRFNSQNEQITTFVNMLGHHYDILYTYIHHMNLINKREENPKLGMPNELLYSVAKQFGWNLTDGRQSQDLWQYTLGTNETGTPLTGSNTVGDSSVPGREITYATWRRIVNNLPLLLKSKGTKRSVQALLSCYGIPQSLISIHEYGGPRLERAPIYEKLNFDYALDLLTNVSGSVVINYNNLPLNAVELRFRTDNVQDNPFIPNSMQLISIGGNIVTLDFQSGDKGVFTINGSNSTQPISVYDGEWASLLMRNNSNGGDLDIVVKKSKYGKIVAAVSASEPGCAFFPFGADSAVLGGSAVFGNRWVGQLQELRFWSSSLQDIAFDNHVKAPGAYNGNVDAYSELLFRLPLTQKINHALTSSLFGAQPASSSISASFSSWTNNQPYTAFEEIYYYDSVSIGASTYDDNKIRLESNELVGNLDVKSRAERSQFDRAPLDSNKLGVYFSPQTMIDDDIIAQSGFVDLDQYIGDPGQTKLDSYPDLIQYSQTYWKKYSQKNDINSYIQMFTLFDLSFFKQLEQLLPARVNKLTGLLIQPNLLERNKVSILPVASYTNDYYECSISDTTPILDATYTSYTASIFNILNITSNDDDQMQGYLTASNSDKYNSVPYSYEYLLRSGSTWITGSSPYWLSEAISPLVLNSSTSEFSLIRVIINNTASYQNSETQDYLPAGINNQKYAGCKLTSPGFNINSSQTVDGGPVVEIITANPNQLIYQNLNQQGSFRLT